MRFGIVFNEKTKTEAYAAGAGLDTPGQSYPIGRCLVDFIELDFLSRLDLPAGEPENPILRFFPDLPRAVASGYFKSAEWLDDMLALRTALDFILADDNSLFSGLSVAQRYYLYEKYVGSAGKSHIVGSYASRPAARGAYEPADSLEDELRAIAPEAFEVVETYEAVSYLDACHIVLMKMIRSAMAVKKCACCGKLFIPQESFGKYCDRALPGGKSCKEVGYIRRMENDPLLKLYNTAYKTKHAQKQRLIRGLGRADAGRYENALAAWRDNARRAMEDCRPKFETCIDTQLKALMLERLKAQLDEDPFITR